MSLASIISKKIKEGSAFESNVLSLPHFLILIGRIKNRVNDIEEVSIHDMGRELVVFYKDGSQTVVDGRGIEEIPAEG